MSVAGVAAESRPETGPRAPRRLLDRWAVPWRRPSAAGLAGFLVGLCVFAVCFLQEPGKQVFDTQLVLPTDPLRFLSRGLHLWDDRTGFGELSDQAYGYLFPMGPFFVLTHVLGLPAWIAQRTWVGLLLVAGYSGTVRLARVLGVGGPAGRIVGGVAYALAPMVLSEVGSISSEAMGQLLAPWALVPLVRAFQPGGPSPRRAAAWSGVAVLFMGGINAFVTLAALPLPAIWLVTRAPGRLRRRVAAWWCAAVGAATLWWVVPLLVFGEYSPRFIDYIESAANTTMPTSLFESLRGTTGWVQYVPAFGGEPWNRAGVALSTHPVYIAATALLALLGLAGLAHRGMPQRRFFLVVLFAGLALVTFGHVGALTPPWAHAARTLLDGPLAPFRNIHRFDAVYRLALVLGAVHLVGLAPQTVVTGAGGAARDMTRWSVRRLTHGGLALVVIAAAFPALQGRLASGGYTALPAWWKQAAGYLAANAQGEQALLLPAAGFGEYSWGRTIDEPFASLADTPWAARIQAPYVPVGNILMMDAVQRALADGRASAGLADYLARAGVGYLVVRNDLDWRAERTLRPSVVHATLDASPGLTRVAAFGPGDGGPPPTAGPGYDLGLEPAYPALELYRVDRPVNQATAYPLSGALKVAGGPESVLALLDAGLAGPATATVSAADPAAASAVAGARPVVTDGLRRQEIDFGKPDDHSSATLTATDPWRLERAANTYDPFPGSGDLTVARYEGVKDIEASSSGSDVTAGFIKGPDHSPYAAFDGNGFTFWDSANTGSPVGEWIQADLEHPVTVPTLTVQLLNGALMGGTVRSIQVSTDSGAVTTDVQPGSVTQRLAMPPGPASRIRLTVVRADGPGLFAIGEVSIPGVQASRTLVAPSAGLGSQEGAFAFTRSDATTGCVAVKADTATAGSPAAPVCSPWLTRYGEEIGVLDRTFTVPGSAAGSSERLTLSGTVRALGGPALDDLLRGTGKVTITASSQLTQDPQNNPAQLLRPGASGSWVANALDPAPSITLSWPGKRVLKELRITDAPLSAASPPLSVHLDSPAGGRDAVIPDNGVVTFPALDTDKVTVTFPKARALSVAVPGLLGPVTLPVGLSGLRFPALDGLVGRLDPAAQLPQICGQGPAVQVDDGLFVPTRVAGTVGAALAGDPLVFETCQAAAPGAKPTAAGKPAAPLELAAGTHRIRVYDSGAYGTATVNLLPGDLVDSGAGTPAVRSTQVLSWTPQTKTVRVGAGDAALLTLRQNANPGWTATLDGKTLRPVTVDGWQAGWLVPAGAGGDVRFVYAPDTLYRAGLLVGAFAALSLIGAALWPGRRRPAPAEPGPDARQSPDERTDQSADWPLGALLLTGVAFTVLAGPWALIPWAAARLSRRIGRWTPLAAALTVAAAVILVVVRVHLGAGNIAIADSPLTQVLCLVALGITASAMSEATPWKRPLGND